MICEEDITSEDIFVISDMNITSEEHIKKDNKSHIFKHLHLPQHVLTHLILFVLK